MGVVVIVIRYGLPRSCLRALLVNGRVSSTFLQNTSCSARVPTIIFLHVFLVEALISFITFAFSYRSS